MSPSIEDIEKQVGRPLQKGDVLVRYPFGNSGRDLTLEEIVKPKLGDGPEPEALIREITFCGPITEEQRTSRGGDQWMGVVEFKNRTDISNYQKLVSEVRKLIKK
jgi:hypothetical protein